MLFQGVRNGSVIVYMTIKSIYKIVIHQTLSAD